LKFIQQTSSELALPTVHVPVTAALGRVASADVMAPIDVPAVACSRMDGYAINTTKIHSLVNQGEAAKSGSGYQLSVGQPVHAGKQNHATTCGDQAIPIMTGGVMPTDADAIVLKEQARRTESGITFEQLPLRGSHIRPIGSDLRQGKKVIKANSSLNAGDIGLLSSLGIAQVAVYAQPKVALVVTGDELVQPGEDCGLGQVYDANTPMLQHVLQAMGCEVTLLPPWPDEAASLRRQMTTLVAGSHDLVISVGGVSMGDKDLIPELLAELGAVVFHKVRVKPGFPLLFGRLGAALYFGLPGNPVSSYTTLCQYVWPAIRQLYGCQSGLTQWRATLTHSVQKNHLRREFMRAHYDFDHDGSLQVSVCGEQQSSRIESLAQATCFLVLNESEQDLSEGRRV